MDSLDNEEYSTEEYPNFDEDGQEYASESLGEKILRKLPLILLILAVFFIGTYLYTSFIGNQVEVTFTIKNLEEQAISNNTLSIQEPEKEEILERKSQESTYTLKLKTGNYTLTVISPGYKTKIIPLEITTDTTDVSITLEKDIPTELSIVSGITGSVGETIQVPVTISNTGNTSLSNIELAVKNVSEPTVSAVIEPSTISVPANGSAQVSLQIRVPSELKLDRDNKKQIHGTIKIKYTHETVDFNVIIYPKPQLEITPASISVRGNAREQVKGSFILKNKGVTKIENIELSTEIVNATVNVKEVVKSWITFTNSGTSSLSIAELLPNETKNIELTIQIPETAKKETITGNLIIQTPVISEPIKKSFSLEIQQEVTVALKLTPSKDTVPVPFNDTTAKYDKVLTEKVTLENIGDITLEDLSISVRNRETCTETWLSFASETTVRELVPEETKPIFIIISAPLTVRGNPTALVCTLAVSYFDKIENTRKEKDTQLRIIPEQ
ncbi:MAG: hypothetical protein Q7S92_03645 [Candidatus Diapherotrites archaeon]|nr:hypothetical protein [Candidatus Diapherotrites archaeon]